MGSIYIVGDQKAPWRVERLRRPSRIHNSKRRIVGEVGDWKGPWRLRRIGRYTIHNLCQLIK